MDAPATQPYRMYSSTGRTELDGGVGNLGRDSSASINEWTHLETDCYWHSVGHSELCNGCLLSVGITPDWHNTEYSISYMGLQNDNEIMEVEQVSDLLGTFWWSIVCVAAGFAAGIYLFPWLKNRFTR